MLGEFFTTTIGKLLVIDVVIQWVAFVVANHYKTEKFYDLTGTHTILMTCFVDKLLFRKNLEIIKTSIPTEKCQGLTGTSRISVF